MLTQPDCILNDGETSFYIGSNIENILAAIGYKNIYKILKDKEQKFF